MVRELALVGVFSLVGLAVAVAQSQEKSDQTRPPQEKPIQQKEEKKEIKNVPAAEVKSKPARISSGARPGAVRPNQPIQRGKPPVKGKPSGTGRPPGN